MAAPHPLSDRYLSLLEEPEEALLAHRPLADELSKALAGGQHLCLRGFSKVGHTTLLHRVLAAACERTGGAAFEVGLGDPAQPDGRPKSAPAALALVKKTVDGFLARVGAQGLAADAARPLAVLGELAAPIFVGADDALALGAVPSAELPRVFEALLDVPKNVKVALVAHRHRQLDAAFAAQVVARPAVLTAFVPVISDDELVQLVQTPALEAGVRFADEALGVLAELSGNRPFELVAFAHLAAARLAPDFRGAIAPEAVAALGDVEALLGSEVGAALVNHCLSLLMGAMAPEEKALVDLLAVGGEAEVTQDALDGLAQAGLLLPGEEPVLNGDVFGLVARALAEGAIRVSAD